MDILVRVVQPQKVFLLISVTELETDMAERDVQTLNADSPISVTEFGIDIAVRDVQLLNAYSPILVTEFGINMEVRDVHLDNAEFSIDVTVFGTSKCPCKGTIADINFVAALSYKEPLITLKFSLFGSTVIWILPQQQKGLVPIVVTELGIYISDREVHSWNEKLPIEVSEFGRDMEVREVQRPNA